MNLIHTLFALTVAFNLPHYPEQPLPEFKDAYPDLPMPRQSEARMTSSVADLIGRVLDKLETTGLRENTIVIMMSDNGHSTETSPGIAVENHTSGYPRVHSYAKTNTTRHTPHHLAEPRPEVKDHAVARPELVRELTALHQAWERELAAIPRQTRDVSGWQVHLQNKLLEAEPADTERALALLKQMLDAIVRDVPAPAVAELRKVPLYFSPAYKSGQSGAEFHPDADWLRDNARDPGMARGVEFSGVHDFEAEMRRMPNFALHELAHAYHHRMLKGGFDNAEIKAAFARVKAAGKYERVERTRGDGQPNTVERAYAMTDPMEYFAETTEAFFARNDFFPFTRDELKQHDPEMFALLGKLWGVTPT